MAVKSVLILTAGFGEGHNAAARNLRDALRALQPGLRVEMRDVFAEAYGLVNQWSVKGYLFAINRLPSLWAAVFRWLDESSSLQGGIGLFGRAAKQLRAILDECQPDVIVSTYPGCNHLLDHLRKHGTTIDARQATIVTDSLTINSVWHSAHSDMFLVANDATAAVLREAGVAPERIVVTGFPVPAFFAQPHPPKTAPAPGERWKVLFMVNSGKRIAEEAVRELAAMPGIELTVTVGRDDVLEKRIRESTPGIRVLGWTTELYALMASSHLIVSKAGGATVQECLAAKTPMIISQVVPGQEEGNARLIVESEAGAVAESAELIAETARRAFSNNGALWAKWHAGASKLSRPNASRDTAEWLLKWGAA